MHAIVQGKRRRQRLGRPLVICRRCHQVGQLGLQERGVDPTLDDDLFTLTRLRRGR